MFKIESEFYVICLVIKVISECAVYTKVSLCLPSSKFHIYFVPANIHTIKTYLPQKGERWLNFVILDSHNENRDSKTEKFQSNE